jgi:hypothetical protein
VLRFRHISDMMSAVAEVVREYVGIRDTRMDALERRIATIEETALHDEGVHADGKSYGTGAVVTHRNSAWICRRPTCARPGESDDWRMISRGSR